ncbi:hypothetical protein PENTCL1PPCAC_21847, partial [Pristionchus entomophagus]
SFYFPLSTRMTFKNERIISDKDYLSSLPNDCIYSIFCFLNHDDLDMLSLVSQRMRSCGVHGRPKARKRSANTLKIYR